MPEGMKENDKFPEPIITPSTKADVGHDEDISKEGQTIPELTDDFVNLVSERYIELYEHLTGEPFVRSDVSDDMRRVEENINSFFTSSQMLNT